MRRLRWLVCAGALALVGCDGRPVSSTAESGKFTPAWPDRDSALQQICLKLQSCGLAEECAALSTDEAQQIEAGLQMIPEPGAFLDCLGRLPCDELTFEDLPDVEDMLEAQGGILGCANIDFTSLQCTGPTSLSICNEDAVCTEVDCASFCAAQGAQGAQCSSNFEIAACMCTDVEEPPYPPVSRDFGGWDPPDAGLDPYFDGWL
jgi:hypothetical protein